MSENYFLIMDKSWFSRKFVKDLRSMKNGDSMTIVYLKIQMILTGGGGSIILHGRENSLYQKLSQMLDENPRIVKETIGVLNEKNLIKIVEINESEDVLVMMLNRR